MRRLSVIVLLGAVFALPAWAPVSSPCHPAVHFPISYHVTTPACASQPLNLVAEACGPCFDLAGWTQLPPGPIQIGATMTTQACILAVCVRDSLVIPIGTFAAGAHSMLVGSTASSRAPTAASAPSPSSTR